MTYTQTGRIIKMTGGLYTVRLDRGIPDSPLTGQTVECRARGTFRHEQMTPPSRSRAGSPLPPLTARDW